VSAPGPAADRQPADSDLPPELAARFVDLGGGEAIGFGSAADMDTIANWLQEHYPDGHAGPANGNPQHDEKCCMSGVAASKGPDSDCPGHHGWTADGRGGLMLDWADRRGGHPGAAVRRVPGRNRRSRVTDARHGRRYHER
jgi:hypothetical protein